MLCGEKVNRLGFGAMRLPCLPDGSIDEKQVQQMIDYAIENGINYFDTAYPYHGGMSEVVLGNCLSKYPREAYLIADKYPGHQLISSYKPDEIFAEQLKKCKVDYFDFYLLHNVYENCIDVYTDEAKGIVHYFIEQKQKGKIKHLGFSTHGDLKVIKRFMDLYGKDIDFCQIQLNYLDWTMQKGKEKYEYFESKNIPLVIMEPLRGGHLCKLDSAVENKMKTIRPSDTPTKWAFNYLQTLDNAKVILSGMSNFEQTQQNIATFAENKPLSPDEVNFLYEIANGLKKGVPCTDCKYCTSKCSLKLDIPNLIALYNDFSFDNSFTVSMRVEAIEDKKQPKNCMHCKNCEKVCPQKIHISDVMTDFANKMDKAPKWAQICKEREEASKKIKLSLN